MRPGRPCPVILRGAERSHRIHGRAGRRPSIERWQATMDPATSRRMTRSHERRGTARTRAVSPSRMGGGVIESAQTLG